MEHTDTPGLDGIQSLVADQFHFMQVCQGTPPDRTPLGLLANGGSDELLDDAELQDLVRPLGLSRDALKNHLVAAYRTIEG